MTAKRLTLSLALILAASAASSNAAELKMSLQDCLRMGLEKNIGLRGARIGPEIAQYNVSIAYSAYEPFLTFNTFTSTEQNAGGLDQQFRPYAGAKSRNKGYSGDVSGQLPWGMNYQLGGGFSDSSGDRPFETTNGVFRRPFENVSGNIGVATIRQPVLRNAWIDGNRVNVALAKEDLTSSDLTYRQRVIDLASAIEKAYYTLIATTEAIAVRQKGLEAAQASLNEASRRVEVGASAPLDKTKAEAEVASRTAQLNNAVGSFDSQQRALKKLLSDDYGNLHEIVIIPTDKLRNIPTVTQRMDSLMKALAQRTELLLGQAELRKNNVELKYSKNQLYPQLDIIGSLGLSASSAGNYSDSFNQITGGDNPNARIAAQIVIPLGNTGPRNRLRAAKANRELLVLNQKEREQIVMKEVEDAIGTINTSFATALSQRAAAHSAMESLAAEQKKLENGKSTTYTVLQYQRDALAAEYDALNAIAIYNVAIAELARVEGETLEHLNIEVPAR